MAQKPFIQFLDITKIFGKNVVLDNLELDIDYNEVFGIIGKSGSGKTTLLSILVGFLKPEKGKVFFQGQDITNTNMPDSIRQQFGFTAQEGSFYPKLTVKENLWYFGRMYNIKPKQLKEKIPKLLKLVNLQDANDVVAWKLSSGMQKRLDIACALIHDPKVLILDEPTEDLDPALRNEILNLLRKINREKDLTIIITSHLLNEMESFCKKVAILDRKKIIDSGNINDLKNKYSKYLELCLEFEDPDDDYIISEIKTNRKIKKYSVRGNKIYIYTNQKGEEALNNVVSLAREAGNRLVNVTMGKQNLTELFKKLTKYGEKEDVKVIRDNKEKH